MFRLLLFRVLLLGLYQSLNHRFTYVCVCFSYFCLHNINNPSLTLFISQVIPCAIYMTPKLIKGFNLLKKLSVSIYLHLFPFALAFPFSCFTYACYRWKTIPIKDIVAGSTSIGFSIPAFVFTTGTSLIIDFVPTLPCKQHALLLNI